MTKQLVVEMSVELLKNPASSAPVPFRLLLQHVGELLKRNVAGLDVVTQYLSEMFGAESAHMKSWCAVPDRPVLLILDGFDEAPTARREILSWVEALDRTAFGTSATTVITSRPAAVEAEGLRGRFGDLGFSGRRVVPLEPAQVEEVVAKFASRRGVPGETARLQEQVSRPDYRGIAEVLVTLQLLLHVLKNDSSGTVLSRTELYKRAVQMMMQAEAFRARLQGTGLKQGGSAQGLWPACVWG